MAGRTPAEAVNAFLEPLQLSLSCVTAFICSVSGGYYLSDKPHALTLNRGNPVPLEDTDLTLTVMMNYQIVKATGERGPYKVQITAYFYSVENQEGQEVIAYHWQPEEEGLGAHLHLGPGAQLGRKDLTKAHIPTGRISLEEVLRFAISELGAKPQREDWADILERNQRQFEKWRTWPSSS